MNQKKLYRLIDYIQNKRNKNGSPTFLNNLIEQKANIALKINKDKAWFEGTTEDEKDFFKLVDNQLKNQALNRFTSLKDRNKYFPYPFSDQKLFNNTWAECQGYDDPPTWKGTPIFKTAFDMVVYQMLLWELKPSTIIELGSGNGSSAKFFYDICKIYNLNTNILSFDILNDNNDIDCNQNINYLYSDNNDIATLRKYDEYFKNMKGPILVIEDSHVNIENTIEYLLSFLKKNDYIVLEDMKRRLITPKFIDGFIPLYNNFKHRIVLDNKYINYFGIENTSAGVGILKVVN